MTRSRKVIWMTAITLLAFLLILTACDPSPAVDPPVSTHRETRPAVTTADEITNPPSEETSEPATDVDTAAETAPTETAPETERATALPETEPESEPVSETETIPHEHLFSEWEIVKLETCTEKGEMRRCCPCGVWETTIRGERPHTEVVLPAVAPTCTEAGLTEGIQCSECGFVLTEQRVTGDPTGHTVILDPAIPPTCTEAGLSEGKHCAVCQTILVEQTPLDKTEHTLADGFCTVCGYGALDYTDPAVYASDYGYAYLSTLTNGDALQAFYLRLDGLCRSFHGDASWNLSKVSPVTEGEMVLERVHYGDLGLTNDDMQLVMSIFKADRPLYYWLSNTWTYHPSEGWMQPQVPMEYGMGIDRVAYNALLYEAVSLYHSMVEDEESAYLIALAYHDLIISAVDYAYQDDGITPEEGAWAHSAIGVFLGMDVVCEGYAKAFQLLLNVSGVENVFVVGIAGGPHAWNLVRLDDGAWYWFDLTWDDNDAAFNDVSYHYFAVTDESVVDWLDAHLGAQTPYAGSLSFLEDHRPYSAMGESYALPERSDTPLSLEGVLELRETFTLDGNTYALVGYNRVQLVATVAEGRLDVPEYVVYDGRTYAVVSMGAMDEQGYFVQDRICLEDAVTELTIAGSILNVDMGAFQGCDSLRSVVLAEGVGSIDHFAFVGCRNLTEVIIPSTVQFIGMQAFDFCFSLEFIRFGGTMAQWEAIEKGPAWTNESGVAHIVCVDGTINR